MKIKFIKSAAPVGFGHVAGDEATYPDAVCETLVETGFAEYVESEKVEKAVSKPAVEKAVKTKK